MKKKKKKKEAFVTVMQLTIRQILTDTMCILTHTAYVNVYAHIHTYIHTFILTHTHIHTHRYIHPYIHTHRHTNIHTYREKESYHLLYSAVSYLTGRKWRDRIAQ